MTRGETPVSVPLPLSAVEIAAHLASRDGWTGDTTEITKTYVIGYHAGVRLIVEVAAESKRVGHHADVDLRWGTVRFGITTHDAGNTVTALDFDLADRIDRIAAEHGATTG
ncbi:pterin-4-alpha-carbinolamine dehydratase [Pseudonocardia sp. CNS-139]|nr:pterin-4-alpha-carbinolamine dehydratase [Pseudonocardia sp. CNS-139]